MLTLHVNDTQLLCIFLVLTLHVLVFHKTIAQLPDLFFSVAPVRFGKPIVRTGCARPTPRLAGVGVVACVVYLLFCELLDFLLCWFVLFGLFCFVSFVSFCSALFD